MSAPGIFVCPAYRAGLMSLSQKRNSLSDFFAFRNPRETHFYEASSKKAKSGKKCFHTRRSDQFSHSFNCRFRRLSIAEIMP